MMDGYMYGLGEGFLEFCGTHGYSMEPSYGYVGDTQLYSDFPDFQADSYIDSPESDQENCVAFFDANLQGLVERMPKKHQQRKAANMRERKRMKSINDAFEHLRKRIPSNVNADRRLSKVDTLRLAIRYISYLSELVKSCGDYKDSAKSKRVQEKIILKCHLSDVDSMDPDTGLTVIGHSLSWSHRQPEYRGNATLSAKIWVPSTASESDLMNLAVSSDSGMEQS